MIYSVSDVNHLAAQLFSDHPLFNQMEVCGEISGGKLYSSGHFYFTLKDEHATMQATMFRNAYQGLVFQPQEGDRVIVRGSVSIYEKTGKYQIVVQEMQPQGVGNLYQKFEQLKRDLAAKGYFSAERKREIPFMPRRIGVATSQSGAVIQDILHVLRRRFPGFKMDFIPVAVQGETAALQIAEAISRFNRLQRVDVIIIGRGGGSLEDLWAFNEKIVADAIYYSAIPVISAVGHETDFTIADFVADLRAPTPSAAAELVLPEKKVLIERIAFMQKSCRQLLQKQLQQAKSNLHAYTDRAVLQYPLRMVYHSAQYLDDIKNRLQREMERIASVENANLAKYRENMQERIAGIFAKQATLVAARKEQLRVLNPFSILDRGYTYVEDETGKIISSSQKVKEGSTIRLIWKDGKAVARILSRAAKQRMRSANAELESIADLEREGGKEDE